MDEKESQLDRICSAHTDLFANIKVLMNQQISICGDLKDLRTDIRNAIDLAQEGIVQNTKNLAIVEQKLTNHIANQERDDLAVEQREKILYNLVGYKNRIIGAMGVFAFILTIYGVIIYSKLTGG